MIFVSSAKRTLMRKGENCMWGEMGEAANTYFSFSVAVVFHPEVLLMGKFWPVLCSIKPERAVVHRQATIVLFSDTSDNMSSGAQTRTYPPSPPVQPFFLNIKPSDRWSQTCHIFQWPNSRKVTQCLFLYMVITTSGRSDKAIMPSSEIHRPRDKGNYVRTFLWSLKDSGLAIIMRRII